MKSIAEIFDNSKELLDSISNFIDKYIGSPLLRKCNITKIVDSVSENSAYEYADSPLSRLTGKAKESKFPEVSKTVITAVWKNCSAAFSVRLSMNL